MMIWLPSFPRCGNKLARIILDSLFHAPTYSFYPLGDEPDKVPITPYWPDPIPEHVTPTPPFSECFFMKTHELPKAKHKHPAIYIVRDGRDAYVSYAHFVMQHNADQVPGMSYLEVLKWLIPNEDHYGGWSRNVKAWTQRKAPTAVIKFEQMVIDPAGSMSAACAWIGCPAPAPSGEMPAFNKLKADEPKQFRKGTVGTWRDEMPPELEELFWSIHGETMTSLGYAR